MKKTKAGHPDSGNHRDLYSGMMPLDILCHAAERPILGFGMVEELARHGYRISPGTFYPCCTDWRRKATSSQRKLPKGKSLRNVYQATPPGRKALAAAKSRVRAFIGELFEGNYKAC